AVLERTKEPDPKEQGRSIRHYALRHLDRFPPGTPYAEVGERAAAVYAGPPLERTPLWVDLTMVGTPVLELLRRSGIKGRVRHLAVGAGLQAAPGDRGGWVGPQGELGSTPPAVLPAPRLQVAASLPDAAALVRELENFRMKEPPSDNTVEWRENPQDDLVFAVALAAWWGEKQFDGDIVAFNKPLWFPPRFSRWR